MPIYMDRHFTEGATHRSISDAHKKDLEIQDKHGVKFLTYWFDEERSTAFCLIEAPNKEAIHNAHDEAHGDIANEIIEVDPAIVESFMGRMADPDPGEGSGKVEIDSAFRVIMFTDLKDSTLMTTIFGDSKALHLLHVHNALIRNALREHGGNEVKHTGDGIMASFTAVEDALKCTALIQKSFAEHNENKPGESLYVRIGLSAGEPIEEHGDLFGSAVQLAARLCAHAEPGQILAAEVIKRIYRDKSFSFHDIGQVGFKGFEKNLTVYEVNW